MKNILKYILILCLLLIMICYPKNIPVLGENNTTLIFTFDDGPNGENTLEILDYLESHNMSATFFMVGNKMSSQKDLVKKVYNSNSEIGYHSYDHTLFTKNKIKNIINDFDKTNKIYYEITKDYLSLTRPPYGEYNNKILKALNTSFILWDKDTHDWKYKDTDFIVKYVLENANDKDIILFHDSYKTTVKAVKKSLRSDYTQHFRAKNKNLLNTICEYASLNPFEAVACDLSKRFIENVNKNKLTIEQNFISKSPYRKHHFFLLPFTKTETNPLSDLLRKCWNGKFER